MQNDIKGMTGEILHWWRVTTHVFFWSDFLLYFCFPYSNRILFFVTLSFSLFTLRGCSKLYFEVNLCCKRSFSLPQGWHIIRVWLWFSIKFSSVLKFLHKFTTLTKDWVWLFLNVYDPMVHIAPRNWPCNILCLVK